MEYSGWSGDDKDKSMYVKIWLDSEGGKDGL
jgi:hypothetical protein